MSYLFIFSPKILIQFQHWVVFEITFIIEFGNQIDFNSNQSCVFENIKMSK